MSAARLRWKFMHRLNRIVAREWGLATTDLLMYGRAYVVMTDDGPRRVPASEWDNDARRGVVAVLHSVPDRTTYSR